MTASTVLPIRSLQDAALDAILAHLARYRLTQFAALRQLPELGHLTPARINAALRNGRRERLIASAPLHDGARYWHLTPEGACRRGLTVERSGPLKEAAKCRAYAMLRFCCLSESPRQLLTRDELARYFPTVYRPGLPAGFYFDSSAEARLGLLRVDAQCKGRWDRTLQTLRHDSQSHSLYTGTRQLIAARRFQITLITAMPQKAARLRNSLHQLRDGWRVPVEIVAMPELLPLMMPCRRKEAPAKHVH